MMYPLRASRPYPRNHWYVAGYGDEFSREPRIRTISGDPVVLFRTEAGDPVALWGICPHRFLPLDHGRLAGDTIVCGYHGYTFDADGRCIDIPTGGEIPSQCRLRSYPVAERGPLVWIWMGDADAADTAGIPDLAAIGLGRDILPGWRFDHGGYVRIAARAPLLVDNLFDLSHIQYIHAASLPQSGGMMAIDPEIENRNGRLRVTRKATNVPITPGGILERFFGPSDAPIFTEAHTEMFSPAVINAAGPWAWAMGDDGGPGAPIGMINFVHVITPETDNSLHYFYFETRDFRVDDTAFSDVIIAQMARVVQEDVTAIEAIERQADRPGLATREISTRADAGVMLARLYLRREIEKETA